MGGRSPTRIAASDIVDVSEVEQIRVFPCDSWAMRDKDRSSLDSNKHVTSPFSLRKRTLTVSNLALEAYARKLASADPTPGGGSASASVGAYSAALVCMVASLTAQSPKHAAVAQRAKEIGELAHGLMETLLRSVDEDVTAFDQVSAAYKLPKASDADKAARSAAIQRALLAATEPPMRVIDAAVEACRLAAELVDFGNRNAISDVGCAALFAGAAVQGAALNVEINTKSLKDRVAADDYADRTRAAIAQVDLLTEVILGKVNAGIAGA